MRTIPLVVVLLVANDVLLAFLLDAQLNGSAVVILAALVLSGTVLAVAAFAVEDENEPPTRRELQEEIESLRAQVEEREN
ncbi:hypothetical protein [Halobacterium zhouii]|uniref:hypothetical protein n=1 Tax=Halobacterium zhouii TaxID=2902624 RepID=UPI001E5695A5|nr:hypothetical protein [Halobacterium zhouii]